MHLHEVYMKLLHSKRRQRRMPAVRQGPFPFPIVLYLIANEKVESHHG